MSERVQYKDTTIPAGGMRELFWKYVERVTGERSLKKFFWQRLIFALFSGFPTIVGSFLRGKIYKMVLGGVGSSCLIEKNVRFFGAQGIFLHNRVFIGEGSHIYVDSLNSKIQLKDKVHISQQVVLRVRFGEIIVGEHVGIGIRSIIRGSGGVEIGKNSLLADQVELISANHIYKDLHVPIRLQGGELKKIVIGEDVWLGAHVIVLAGVTIGKGSVVGAGAVVTKDIPSYSIAIGVPARVIDKRK